MGFRSPTYLQHQFCNRVQVTHLPPTSVLQWGSGHPLTSNISSAMGFRSPTYLQHQFCSGVVLIAYLELLSYRRVEVIAYLQLLFSSAVEVVVVVPLEVKETGEDPDDLFAVKVSPIRLKNRSNTITRYGMTRLSKYSWSDWSILFQSTGGFNFPCSTSTTGYPKTYPLTWDKCFRSES